MNTTVPLRRIAKLAYGAALSSEVRADGDVSVMSSGGVSGTHSVANTLSPVVVVGRKGTFGSVHWSDSPAFVIDTAYFVDQRFTKQDLRWLHYVLLTLDFASTAQDVGVPGLSRDAAYGLPCPVPPPLETQRLIAHFLDEQVGRIDEIVRSRKEQIDSLEQRARMGLVAVLEGLSLQHPTGVPWFPLGSDHWPVRPLKAVSRCLDRYRIPLSAEERSPMQGDIPYYGASSAVDHIDRYIFDEDLVLFGEDGAALENMRSDVVQTVSGKCWVNNHTHVLASNGSVDLGYLASYLRVVDRRAVLSGSTRPKVTQEDLMSVPVVVPPLSVQRDLADGVRAIRAGTTRVVAEMKHQVLLLAERKRSLIAATVMGEFDVTTASGRGI